jgi:hypothetical protein
MTNVGEISLSAPPPVRSKNPIIDVWIGEDDKLTRVAAKSDVLVAFSHKIDDPIDAWKMFAAPRERLSDRATFLALFNSLKRYGESQGWFEQIDKSNPAIKHRTMKVPLPALPELQKAIQSGDFKPLEKYGNNGEVQLPASASKE